MKGKNVPRLLRLVVLLIAGSGATIVIVALSFPYGLKFHPLVFAISVPFVFFNYIQLLRYRLRCMKQKSGVPAINKRWIIGGFVVALLLFGCYSPNAGDVAHGILSCGVACAFLSSCSYVTYFSRADGFHDWRKIILSEVLEDVVWLTFVCLLIWYCYTAINEWEYSPANIIEKYADSLAFTIFNCLA